MPRPVPRGGPRLPAMGGARAPASRDELDANQDQIRAAVRRMTQVAQGGGRKAAAGDWSEF